MNCALLIVDVQRDLLSGGALQISGAEDIIEPIQELAHRIRGEGGLIVATRDQHPLDHISFSQTPAFKDHSWPVHCVQGTKGAQIDPRIRKCAQVVVSKGMNKDLEEYSGFDATTLRPIKPLHEILQESEVDSVCVVGLALDYCVGQTAFDANALGYETSIALKATKFIHREGTEKTISMCLTAGVDVR